jgi:hypothetical protein
MENIKNLHLPDDLIVDPKLKPLIVKLALDKPNWLFDARFSSARRPSFISSRACASFTDAPEGKNFIQRLRVMENGEYLGEIGIERNYRVAGRETMFVIMSWRIAEQRQRSSAAKTSKLDVAVRTAKKAFVSKSYGELLNDVERTVASDFGMAVGELMRPISMTRLAPSASEMQMYCYYMANGMEVPPTLDKTVKTAFCSEKFSTALSQYGLGEKLRTLMATGYMLIIHILPDEAVLYRDPANNHAITRSEMHTLPEKWQSNIAVLRLMQDNEMVLDIGFRQNSDNFAIVI